MAVSALYARCMSAECFVAFQSLEEKLQQARASRDQLDADMAVAERRSGQAQRTIAAVMREVVRWKENAEVQDKRHSEVRTALSGMWPAQRGTYPC